MPDDDRLPHLIDKIQSQIHKTALGAETSIDCRHITDIQSVLNDLRKQGFALFAVEQTSGSQLLPAVHQIPAKVALVVGREVEGIEPDVIAQCDGVLEIPMLGQKESLNVAQAAAIALYHCQFIAKA